MDAPTPTFIIEVLHGNDRGARIEVGATLRTIGRAVDHDMVLRDLAVSRQHLTVIATAAGVLFSVVESASALIMEGRTFRSIEVKPTERIVVGNTMLGVHIAESASLGDRPSSQSRVELHTLRGGAGADALAMGSIHNLVELADAATDFTTLQASLQAWAAELTPRPTVEVIIGPAAGTEVLEEGHSDVTVLLIPTPANEPISLRITYTRPGDRLPNACRRMWVVAGRVVGSAFVRLWRDEVAAAEVAFLRTLSFGSARSFLGTSPAAENLSRLLPRICANTGNVLIDGETGVGKTFVARLLHENGPHAREPLRVVSCGAVPESLIESELFGHERGAFTGAVSYRIGAFESAGHGTIFLDEIGELSLSSQAKLLRVLEERKFERIGSNTSRTLEARVITATNRNLDEMVAAKLFRSDLFFRISVFRLTVPALRDRGEDRILLAEHLLRDAARSAHRRLSGFSAEALDAIRSYSWPGNVRELRNAIEYAVAVGDGPILEACDFPTQLGPIHSQPANPNIVYLPLSLAELEQRGVQAAMRSTQGNQRRAAALLGISRSTLNVHLAAARKADPDPDS